MALPAVFIDALKAVPAKDLEHLCTMSKLEYNGQKMTARMLVDIFEKGDKLVLKQIYNGIAPVLMVGGMLPGVGLACNVIDAAFCFTIGAWIDFAIDAKAIALFEVPGVSGLKGVSKGMMGLCKCVKIDVKAFWKIMDKLGQCNILREGKIHELFSFLMSPSNKLVEFVDVNAIARSVSNANLFKWGDGILAKVTKECEACGVKVIQNTRLTIKTSSIVANHQVSLLKLTERGIK